MFSRECLPKLRHEEHEGDTQMQRLSRCLLDCCGVSDAMAPWCALPRVTMLISFALRRTRGPGVTIARCDVTTPKARSPALRGCLCRRHREGTTRLRLKRRSRSAQTKFGYWWIKPKSWQT